MMGQGQHSWAEGHTAQETGRQWREIYPSQWSIYRSAKRKKRKRLTSHPSNNQSERAENSQEKYNRCPINKKKKTQLIGKQPSERQLLRTSLEVQWIGIYLPTQGTRVRSLVREDATCFRQLKAKSHSYQAPVPQLLKPVHREPVLQGKRSHWNETPQDGSKD